MTRIRQSGRNSWVALAAALALVLQLVSAAQAMPVQLDIFGNPICATGIDGSHGAPSHGGGHEGMECCLLGCAAPLAGPLPVAAALDVRWQRQMRAVFAAVTSGALAKSAYRPGNPRAPPLTA